jgi:hypothetical protein
MPTEALNPNSYTGIANSVGANAFLGFFVVFAVALLVGVGMWQTFGCNGWLRTFLGPIKDSIVKLFDELRSSVEFIKNESANSKEAHARDARSTEQIKTAATHALAGFKNMAPPEVKPDFDRALEALHGQDVGVK